MAEVKKLKLQLKMRGQKRSKRSEAMRFGLDFPKINVIIVSGQWSVVSGQWSVVSGQWSVVSGQWSVVRRLL